AGPQMTHMEVTPRGRTAHSAAWPPSGSAGRTMTGPILAIDLTEDKGVARRFRSGKEVPAAERVEVSGVLDDRTTGGGEARGVKKTAATSPVRPQHLPPRRRT